MCLYYASQPTFVVFGSKSSANARTAVALTDDRTENEFTVETGGMSKLNLDFLYTTGAAETNNELHVVIECSPDGTNWYRIPNDSTVDGTSTLTQRDFKFVGASAGTAYTISVGIDIFYKHMKISVYEAGVAANAGTVYCEGTLSGK